MTVISYPAFKSDQTLPHSHKPGAPRLRTADAHYRHTPAPWYWRVLAFLASSILLAGFLAIQPLYEVAPHLTVPKTTITVLSIASLTLGWSFTPLLCFAVQNPSFRNEAIFIPGASSSLLGLLILSLNFAITTRYHWVLPAILGIAASAISTIIYIILVILTQYQIARRRQQAGSDENEFEASLIGSAAPMQYSSSRPSYSSAERRNPPPHTAWSNGSTNLNETLAISQDRSQRSHSPSTADYAASLYTTPTRAPSYDGRHALPSPAPTAHRTVSPRRPSSLHSEVTVAHAPGEAPVMTVHAPSPPPEEEVLRLQMLRLLVNQTSEQAARNPNHETFQIDIPREMREALVRASVDNDSVRLATTPNAESQGRAGAKADRSHGENLKATKHGLGFSGAMSTVKDSLTSAKNTASPGGASIQETPQSAYAPSQGKSREERRREIELASG